MSNSESTRYSSKLPTLWFLALFFHTRNAKQRWKGWNIFCRVILDTSFGNFVRRKVVENLEHHLKVEMKQALSLIEYLLRCLSSLCVEIQFCIKYTSFPTVISVSPIWTPLTQLILHSCRDISICPISVFLFTSPVRLDKLKFNDKRKICFAIYIW